jgi:putative ABC transport system permease protein
VREVLGAPILIPMSLFSQWTPLNLRPANQVYVRTDPDQRLEAQRALSALPAVIGVEDWSQTSADVADVIAFNGNFAYIFLGFGLLLTFVVLFNTINANVYERRNELAIMRMQGVSLAEIRLITTWETLIAVTVGLLIGLIPALAVYNYIISLYQTDVAGNMIYINPVTWIIAIALLVATALVTQLLPLRQIARANLGDVSKSVSV